MTNPKMGALMPASPPPETDDEFDDDDGPTGCVMAFNANDPSGAGGTSADLFAIASVGAHAMPVTTGVYARDTTEIHDFFPLDDEAVTEQARIILEDVPVQVFKVGFVGSPENLSAIAELSSDYSDVPLVAYMPDLSWWQEDKIDLYLDAFNELLLPQTTVLVGNHSTLSRWLLPDWSSERSPTARDIAKAANAYGVPYTLVTGIPLPEQFIENTLCTPTSVLCSEKYERFEAVFTGAGDTLSAALAALIASGTELAEATTEALSYLDRCLEAGFRPGMGNVIPDRLFWAHPETDDEATPESNFEISPNDTRH
ncbi:MAG: hydroxymethylpyrimidine/phosphomethylpyrimidine kinase [Burkholderiales bacterium PBB3]|nr:MAG: hydroxymethylpyrimidine/phosphomethylpyrimidine kinase [Burkholderiales bacterium PBB3]